MLHWKWRSFSELTNQELYNLIELRQTVFVIEQQCIYTDMDYLDQECMHLLGMKDNKLAGYLRVLPKDVAYPNAVSIGRVVTAPFARGQGVGKELLTQALDYLDKTGNLLPILIGAQLYLEKFYQSFGFETVSEPYDEDGILHIKMKKI
jgi:ElaA protein